MTNNYCHHCESYKTDEELIDYKCPKCVEYVYIKFETETGPKATHFILANELERGDMIPIPYTDDFREILRLKESDNDLLIGLKQYKQIKVSSTKRVNKLEGTWRL
ncbi:hypothetical protein [Tenacibaculum sp.]|uniref:hypothetical protein n=1 Tax=Tenacibaculum sp. TaxID=1906242 RepID=UPI003AA9C1EE